MALVGAGEFGADFARYVNEVAQLVAICDPSAPSRSRFAEVSGLQLVEYQDLKSLLAEAKIDAVVITTPHHTHKQIAIEAAKAGKHIYCDKVMANSVVEFREIVDA